MRLWIGQRFGKNKKVSNENSGTESYNNQNQLSRWLNIRLHAAEERISELEDGLE